MIRRPRTHRLVVALATWALLLKAAVPLLAATAAELQGVPTAQICPIYGVALTAPGHPAPGRLGPEPVTAAVASPDEAAALAAFDQAIAEMSGLATAATAAVLAGPGDVASAQVDSGHGPALDATAAAAADPHAGHGGHDPAGPSMHEHQGCVLGALASLAPPDGSTVLPAADAGGRSQPGTNILTATIHDASARWVAGRKHGPPTRA
jgi:hypothetical protein